MSILLFKASTSIYDIAISGIVITICSILFYYFYKSKKIFTILLLTVCAGCVVTYLTIPWQGILHGQGRYGWWLYYLKVSQSMFITGAGIGHIQIFRDVTPYKHIMHVHNEYIQFLFELGLIGFVLCAWAVKNFFRCRTGLILKSIFFGYLVSSFFNYPMHLWVPSVFACVCYSGVIALNERETCP